MSKYASLNAGILARKGEAAPAATPLADLQLTRVGAPSPDLRGLTAMPGHQHVEPGYAKHHGVKPPAPTPIDSAVFGRRPVAPPEPVEDEEQTDNHCSACPGPSPEDAAKTYHVNLRLKRMRFVKLKLSAALLRRPVQDIVAEALDDWFEKLPRDVMGDCACLKARCE
jgi:hypothetical protein